MSGWSLKSCAGVVKYIPPWRKLYLELLPGHLDYMMDLIRLDFKPLMDHLEAYNKGNIWVLGFLPLMCKSLVRQLGTLCAQSLAERMILAYNLLVTKQWTLLDDDLVNMLIVLQVNQNFMEFV